MAMSPKSRAALASQRDAKSFVPEYVVHDPNLQSVGGFNVIDKDGKRVVRMSPDAARYWLDQGVLLPSGVELSKEGEQAMKQFRRDPIEEDSSGDGGKPKGNIRPPRGEAAAKA